MADGSRAPGLVDKFGGLVDTVDIIDIVARDSEESEDVSFVNFETFNRFYVIKDQRPHIYNSKCTLQTWSMNLKDKDIWEAGRV